MSLPDVLREYGEAFRGDWSSSAIDGRGVRSELQDIARWIEHPNEYPGDAGARTLLGICLHGLGHWSAYYCDEDCELPR